MTPAFWFWLFMVVALFYGWWREYTVGQPYPYPRAGWYLVNFLLFALLGWKVFGNPFDALIR